METKKNELIDRMLTIDLYGRCLKAQSSSNWMLKRLNLYLSLISDNLIKLTEIKRLTIEFQSSLDTLMDCYGYRKIIIGDFNITTFEFEEVEKNLSDFINKTKIISKSIEEI